MIVCTMSIHINLSRSKKFKKYILFFNLLRFIGIDIVQTTMSRQYQNCTSFHSQVICKKTNMICFCLPFETRVVNKNLVVCTMSIPISLSRLKNFKKYISFLNLTQHRYVSSRGRVKRAGLV